MQAQTKKQSSSRRLAVQSWLAVWLQHRRRKRAGVQPFDLPAAPFISGYSVNWGASAEGWADVTLNFSFDQGTFQLANLEVWYRVGESGGFTLLDWVPSDAASFTHQLAASSEAQIFYKMRYANGVVVGPWSNELEVNVGL